MTFVEMLQQQVAMKKRLVVQAERNLEDARQELADWEATVAYFDKKDTDK